MKALKKLISLMMLSLLFQACEQDETSLNIPSVLDQRYFEASISTQAIGGSPVGSTTPFSSLDLRYTGWGKSNLLSDIVLEASHRQLYSNDPLFYKIENGEFLITAKSGELLFGEYDGFGSYENGQVGIFENYQIQGGTGRFHKATGNLSVRSYQLADCNDRDATISGTIYLEALEATSGI